MKSHKSSTLVPGAQMSLASIVKVAAASIFIASSINTAAAQVEQARNPADYSWLKRPAPDEDVLGKAGGYPAMRSRTDTMVEANKVGTMTSTENFYSSRAVKNSGPIRALTPMTAPPDVRYTIKGASKSLDDLLAEKRVTGLLILKGDKTITERYQYDRKAEMKFLGYSMSKTVTGVLVGAALKDGAIKSIDDTVDMYVTDLKGLDYGKVTIRNLLRMTSGMRWNESGAKLVDSDEDDVSQLAAQTYRQYGSGRGGIDFVKKQVADPNTPQGTKWNYSSCDTEVLGLVIKAATGKNVSQYTSEKIWSKIGAEGDAHWNTDWSGQEATFAYFNARVRDWTRFALWMAEGMADTVTPEYFAEMTSGTVQPEHLKPRKIYKYWGYGYQTWLMPYHTKTFAMVGSWGQRIIIQPDSKVVAVIMTAGKTRNETLEQFIEDIAVWHGILKSVGSMAAMLPTVP